MEKSPLSCGTTTPVGHPEGALLLGQTSQSQPVWLFATMQRACLHITTNLLGLSSSMIFVTHQLDIEFVCDKFQLLTNRCHICTMQLHQELDLLCQLLRLRYSRDVDRKVNSPAAQSLEHTVCTIICQGII